MLSPILIKIKIEPDELITGWCRLLATINNLDITKFAERLLGYHNGRQFRPDYLTNIENIYAANADSSMMPDPIAILRYHTAHYAVMPFQKQMLNARNATIALRDYNEIPFLPVKTPNATYKEYKVCPLCVSEDMESLGRPVIHVPHQLPGVVSCHRHHCDLIDESSYTEAFEPRTSASDDISVAEFMYRLYENPIFTSYEYTMKYLAAKGESLTGYWRTSREGLIRHLALTYGYDDFISNIQVITEEKFSLDFEDLYSIMSEFGPVTKLQCNQCGHIFYADPSAADAGFGCTNCLHLPENEEEQLNYYLERHHDGYYKVKRMLPKRKAEIEHTVCGNIVTKNITNFLWKHTRCSYCERKTISEWQKQLDEIRPGFIVEETYKKKSTRYLSVKHSICGESFSIESRNLIEEPYCRCCENDHIQRKFYKSFGSEADSSAYTILSRNYDKNGMDFHHKDCGTVSHMKPSQWVSGKRCSLCYEKDGHPRKEAETYLHVAELIRQEGSINRSALSALERKDLELLIENHYLICHDDQILLTPDTAHTKWHHDKRLDYPKSFRVGETVTTTCGLKCTIIRYQNNVDIDVEFEDGYVVQHQRYDHFKEGYISHPSEHSLRFNDRTGETRVANNGEKMTIIAYRDAKDIDIRFDDGTVLTGRDYQDFSAGRIRNPNSHHTNLRNDRVGETKVMKNGMRATIITYRASNDIDVQFSDGQTVTGKRYSMFKNGRILHPSS